MIYQKSVKTYFEDHSIGNYFKQLSKFECPLCSKDNSGVDFTSVAKLKDHLNTQHHVMLCNVCVEFRKVYFREQPTFKIGQRGHKKSSEIKEHLNTEHFQCRFCQEYKFDEEALYDHLQKDHFSCFICDRNGLLYRYYQNYAALERHYDAEHFMCQHTSTCQGVVFEDPTDLKIHNHRVHFGAQAKEAAASSSKSRRFRIELSDLHATSSNDRRDRGRTAPEAQASNEVSREERDRRRRVFSANDVVFAGASSFQNGNPSQQNISANHPSKEDATAASSSTASISKLPLKQGFRILSVPVSQEEFRRRNTEMVSFMRSICDPVDFERFRDVSGQFRSGEIHAEEFFKETYTIFGKDHSGSILSELAALLPDESLRNALILVSMRELGSARRISDEQNDDEKNADDAEHSIANRAEGSSSSNATSEAFPSLSAPEVVLMPRAAWNSLSANTTMNSEEAFPELPQLNASVQSRRQPPHVPSNRPSSAASSSRNLYSVPEESFPGLPSVSSRASGPREGAEASNGLQDPSMRVGAVWGGANQVKRKGRGKQPAQAPDLSHLTVSDPPVTTQSSTTISESAFPSLSSTNGASSSRTNAFGSTSNGSGQPFSVSMPSPNSSNRSVVLDLTEMNRQKRKEKAGLYGNSSSGTPWDRKKIAAKKQAEKRSNGN